MIGNRSEFTVLGLLSIGIKILLPLKQKLLVLDKIDYSQGLQIANIVIFELFKVSNTFLSCINYYYKKEHKVIKNLFELLIEMKNPINNSENIDDYFQFLGNHFYNNSIHVVSFYFYPIN